MEESGRPPQGGEAALRTKGPGFPGRNLWLRQDQRDFWDAGEG
jgi:hypothetical protein